jgi:hypothetical protein
MMCARMPERVLDYRDHQHYELNWLIALLWDCGFGRLYRQTPCFGTCPVTTHPHTAVPLAPRRITPGPS